MPQIGRGLAAGNGGSVAIEGEPPHIMYHGFKPTPEIMEETLKWFEEQIVDYPVEHAIIFTTDGDVYHCSGGLNNLDLIVLLDDKLNGAIVTHNHPINSNNEYSFSKSDRYLFMEFKLARLRGIDEKFVYEFNRNSEDVDDIVLLERATEEEGILAAHAKNVAFARENKIGYRRWKR